jgi:uncharacterized protein YcbX
MAAAGGPEARLPLAMTRFRPNVVVAGLPAWEEDKWRKVLVLSRDFGNTEDGGTARPIELLSVKPCGRCGLLVPVMTRQAR